MSRSSRRSLCFSALLALLAAWMPSPGCGATLERTLLSPSTGPQASAFQGSAVAVSAQYVAVGAELVRLGANSDGAVRIYSPTSGVLLHTLRNPVPSDFGRFGTALAMEGATLVVGVGANDVDPEADDDTGAVYVYDLASATPTVPMRTLRKATPVAGDFFGSGVAISGTRVAVGAPGDDQGAAGAGRVYLFNLAGGTPELPVGSIDHPVPTLNDAFGRRVALAGDTLVVGAPERDQGATAAGAAYVFDLASGTPGTPVQSLANPSPALDDRFGNALAVSGNRVVVGVGQDDTGGTNIGLVYVYDVTVGSTPVLTVNNPAGAAGDTFGEAVALEGARLLVGAINDDAGGGVRGGVVHCYDLDGGTPGTPVQTLLNPGTTVAADFGCAVAVLGTRVVVGAEGEDSVIFSAGAAYQYELAGGTPTVAVFTFAAPYPADGDLFGTSVAVSGSRVVVGARLGQLGTSILGFAAVYDLAGPTPGVPVAVLEGPAAPGSTKDFGEAVAIDGDLVVVGTRFDDGGGKAYVYNLASGTPTVPIHVLPNPTGVAGDDFGDGVAVFGQKVIVGSPENDTGGTDAGRAFVFDLTSGTPTVPVLTLTHPTPASNQRFGEALAVSQGRLVVGARGVSSFRGAVIVFDLQSGTPGTAVRTLPNPTPVASEEFGCAVAIDGGLVVVGARFVGSGPYPGEAYVFDLDGGTPTIPIHTLMNKTPPDFYLYGDSVAISGTTVAVGAHHDAGQFAVDGMVFLYDLGGATPTTAVQEIFNPTPAEDYFGFSLAAGGGRLLVGAPHDTNLANLKGAAHVFNLGAGGSGAATVVVATNEDATGAGLPAGTKFATFSAPDVGVFGGTVRTAAGQKLDAVFDETGTVLLRGQQMVAVDPAGGGDMGMITKLAPPTGDAVLATLDRRSGATSANDQVLFVGLQDSDPEAMVRKGQEVPGLPGVTLKSFLTLDGNGDTTFFSGKLAGTGVNGGNNTAIFAASPTAGFKIMVRKGQMVDGKPVKIIATLVGTAGTLAEGRWRGGTDSMGMRLTFADKTQALYLMRVTDNGPADWLRLGQTGDGAGVDVPGAMLKSFMLPAHAPDAVVFDSLLQIGPGSITRKNNRAVFDAQGVDTRGPIALRLLAQVAGPAPALTNVQRFLNTLAGQGRAATMIANSSLQGQRTSRTTIYDARQDGVLVPIARIGDDAPGGGKFTRFVSVAKPDGQGYGALVSALLGVNRAAGVTPANRAALFARNSSGQMQRILRAGDMIESAGPGSPLKSVKSFVALSAAPGSIGAARGYDDTGKVSVLATFADRTQAVVRVQVP